MQLLFEGMQWTIGKVLRAKLSRLSSLLLVRHFDRLLVG